jgi:hypothetical protein
MNTIVKINFIDGPIATGFIHLNENNEVVLFTNENGDEILHPSSWYVPEEV